MACFVALVGHNCSALESDQKRTRKNNPHSIFETTDHHSSGSFNRDVYGSRFGWNDLTPSSSRLGPTELLPRDRKALETYMTAGSARNGI
jgi:hypothetical protein